MVAHFNLVQSLLGKDARELLFILKIIGPQIIDPCDVIGVGVREQNCCQMLNVKMQSLSAKIGAHIDEKLFIPDLEKSRGAPPLVLTQLRCAHSARAADHRHPCRSPRS